jgi:ADP-dependent NAD(P)H-hydrate dehydratase
MRKQPVDLPERAAIEVTSLLLQQWRLPMPDKSGDKNERGRILIVGGSSEMPGAVILAATAALRAGAGKLTIATSSVVAPLVAQTIPEARVIGLDETPDGGIALEAVDRIPLDFDCVLIGPGMQDEDSTCQVVSTLVHGLKDTSVVLDACAMNVVGVNNEHRLKCFESPVLLTPHAGELAHLSGKSREEIEEDPMHHALDAARAWNAVVALKGAVTYLATPDGQVWRHEGGNIGLAISGSGDTLAGIAGGLLARGATLAQGAVWSVALHARAGERLAERHGALGYLAREIPGEVPQLMHGLSARS